MIERVLVAVDDSPAALAAARLAVSLCADWDATLRVVTAVPGAIPAVAHATPTYQAGAARVGRIREAQAVLRYVARLAERCGVRVQTALLDGEAAPAILDETRDFSPDLLVVGRSGLGGSGQPYVGSQTRHVLEFAEVPVLVVPPLVAVA